MKGKAVTQEQNALQNRIQKNIKKLKSYLTKNGITAYRLYNKDIPEYPYLIDIYDKHAVVYEQGKKLDEEETPIRQQHQADIAKALSEVLHIESDHQHFKVRQKQKGNEQYRPLDPRSQDFFVIAEPPFKFLVNMERYLDTGLFLDHRPLRQHLLTKAKGKRVLNLFCYTGSLSVAAAKGGASKVTSVDMSRTYLDWAHENFIVNDLDPRNHPLEQADVLHDLAIRKLNNEKFDLILLDPPSFSNSKRMEDDLDIERDHALLIRDCMQLLEKDGALYFSTNKRKFELHSIVSSAYQVKEISQWTIPQDFHHSNIHRAFLISHKPG